MASIAGAGAGLLVLTLGALPALPSTHIVHPKPSDVELLNQNGEKVRFLSEVIGNRLAAITFTFTTCHTICPTLDGIFKKLQKKIEGDLGKDTVLITLTVDPVTDIPERIKAHAATLGAPPGWSFLTGDPPAVYGLLKALEVYTPSIYDHPPTVYVVDGRRDVWTRLNGFPTPEKIVEILEGYRSARRGK